MLFKISIILVLSLAWRSLISSLLKLYQHDPQEAQQQREALEVIN